MLDACPAGWVTLSDASPERLAAQLHRAKLMPAQPSKDPGRTLRIEGFSPAAARALVERRAPEREAAQIEGGGVCIPPS